MRRVFALCFLVLGLASCSDDGPAPSGGSGGSGGGGGILDAARDISSSPVDGSVSDGSANDTATPPGDQSVADASMPPDDVNLADTSIPPADQSVADQNGIDISDPDANADAMPPGEAGGPLPDYRSGSRLRAMVYKTADGDRMWHGWYDNQFKMPCSYRKAEDNKTRCMPFEFANQYLDSECKTLILGGSMNCTVAPYAVSEPAVACGGYVLHSVGALVTPTRIYVKSGAACNDAGIAPSSNIYHALSALPADATVAAKEVIDKRGTDLAVRYLEADDGALQPVASYDLARATECAPSVAPFADRCAPTQTANISTGSQFWADAQCSTTRLGAAFACPDQQLVAVAQRFVSADQCGNTIYDFQYSEIGAEFTAASFVTYSSGGCMADTPRNGRRFLLGAAIAPTALPEIGTVQVGAGRLRLRYRTAAGGEKLNVVSLHDSQRQVDCAPAGTPAGLRCLPAADLVSYHSDDKCTKALAYTNLPATGCAERMPPAFVRTGGWTTECSGKLTEVHFHAVGAKLTAPIVYQGPITCELVGNLPSMNWYDTSEIASTEFPLVEDVTE